MSKRTPLYETHLKYGGNIVDFAGFELPIQYKTGILAEHAAVRTKVGLFDVSHMGEFVMKGAESEAALNYLLTNSFCGMYDGQVRYTVMCYPNGGEVDDLIVYRVCEGIYFIVVNAGNLEKDFAWMSEQIAGKFDVEFENISDNVAELALQGPLAESVLQKLLPAESIPQKYYSFIKTVEVGGIKTLLSRTGYTGERGYELYCAAADAAALYEILMETGAEFGILPAGLGARDTLRLEAGMPLYGHELSADIPANEVKLDFAIKMDKADFIGKKALEEHVPQYTRVGAKVVDKGIAREHTPIFAGDEEVGIATSGTFAPTLGYAIAMLRIKKDAVEKELFAEVRGRRLKLQIVPLPFYQTKK